MKRSILQNKFYLWMSVLMLTACTQDELTKQGDTLPEGMYPLQISGITLKAESSVQPWGADVPQTRVSESKDGNSSVWQNGDKINVQIGNGTPGVYTYTDGKPEVANGDAPAYWANTDNGQTITAWYTSLGSKTVDLSNQTNGLAYVLTAQTIADFNEPASLTFSHALAKIRVVLTGEQAEKVTTVQVKSLTRCTYDKAKGTVSGSSEGWIEMLPATYNGETYWEANVVPDHEIREIQLNGNTPCNLKSTVNPVGGSYHEITITVNQKIPVVQGGETIDKPGDYIMKGTITESVTLSGDGITLTLDGINSTANNAIHITSGNPTLVVKGTSNSFSCSDTPILLDPNANVTIKGSTDEPTDSKLTIRTSSTDGVAGIGSASESSCGNISIANVTLDVHGGTGTYGGAAIGTNGNFGSSCDNITIENSIVYAKGGTGASAIGLSTGSYSKSCGEIKIIHSKIFATTTYDDFYNCYAACIGHGAYAEHTPVSVGKITITTTETKEVFFSTDRFKALDVNGNEVTTGFYKVGKCTNSSYQSLQTWQGVTFNGESLADGNSNGYK